MKEIFAITLKNEQLIIYVLKLNNIIYYISLIPIILGTQRKDNPITKIDLDNPCHKCWKLDDHLYGSNWFGLHANKIIPTNPNPIV